VALSDDWLRSAVCDIEWQYARDLNRPVIPVKLADLDAKAVPFELAKLQWVTPACEAVIKALGSVPAAARPDPLPDAPPVPTGTVVDLIGKIHALKPNLKQQSEIMTQLRGFLDSPDLMGWGRSLLGKLHDHPLVLAAIRDQIEEFAPSVGAPQIRTRLWNNRIETYTDFVGHAGEQVYNFGAGLAGVGPHIASYYAALDRGIALRFLLVDPRAVTDAIAQVFHKKSREVRREIENTLESHLAPLARHAAEHGAVLEIRLRQTHQDFGVMARDLDRRSGGIVVEHFVYDLDIDDRPALLLYPGQKLYETYRQAIRALWEDAEPWNKKRRFV
jgi:hypothetical protein